MTTWKQALAGAILLSFPTAGAQAATATFESFLGNGNTGLIAPSVTVEDVAAGGVRVSVGIVAASDYLGALAGLFFDVSGKTVAVEDLGGLPDSFVSLGLDTRDLGAGVDLFGDIDRFTPGTQEVGSFDFGLRFADEAVSPAPLTFTLADLGAADFERVGLLFTGVGFGGPGGGSNKLAGTAVLAGADPDPNPGPDPMPSPVPLPAGAWLLASALGAAFAAGARRAR